MNNTAKEILERLITSLEVGNEIDITMLENIAEEYGIEL